jgi:DME family drug/metabolite transporter
MTRPAPATARIGVLQICAAGVLWGTGGLSVQLIRRHADLSPLTISAWRMAVAALVLLTWTALSRRAGEVRQLLAHHRASAVSAGLLTAAYQALYFAAVVNVGVSVATVVALGLAPVLLIGAESIAARRMPSAKQLVVLALALVGLVLVSAGGTSSHAAKPALGVALAVASGATYALATALARPAAAAAMPLALSTVTSTVGAVGLVPVALILCHPVASGNPVALGWLLYLGVMSLAVVYSLFYAGLRTVSGSAAVLGTLLEPVTAAAAAALVLGERLSALGIVGAVLILVAVAGLGEATPPEDLLLDAPPPP